MSIFVATSKEIIYQSAMFVAFLQQTSQFSLKSVNIYADKRSITASVNSDVLAEPPKSPVKRSLANNVPLMA